MASERFDHYATVYEAEDSAQYCGLQTGFAGVDARPTGLAPGQLIVLAGRPGMGKTALALDIAANVAVDQGKSVTVCSLEMTKEQLFSRFLARRLGVPAWKLEKGSFDDADFERIGSVLDGFADHPLYIDDDADTSLVNIRSKARRQQMQHGLDLLIVDYLQLIEVTDRLAGDTQTQRVTYISKSLKQLGRSRLSMQTDGRHGGSGMAFPSADSSPHNCRLGRTFFDR